MVSRKTRMVEEKNYLTLLFFAESLKSPCRAFYFSIYFFPVTNLLLCGGSKLRNVFLE
jgi:hypothetical protein